MKEKTTNYDIKKWKFKNKKQITRLEIQKSIFESEKNEYKDKNATLENEINNLNKKTMESKKIGRKIIIRE